MTVIDLDEYRTHHNRKHNKRNRIIANNDNQSVNSAPPQSANVWTDDGWYGHFQNVNGEINFIPIYRRQVGV